MTTTVSPRPIRAVVIGHTGATGKALIDTLLATPHCESIVAIGRREGPWPSGTPKLRQVVLPDMLQLATIDPAVLQGANAAFCCIGTPFNDVFKKSKAASYRSVDFGIATEFAKLARGNGVEFFSVITGEGTEGNSQLNMYRVKSDVEVLVKGLGFERVAFLRPGFLNRGRDAGWVEKIMSLGGLLGLPVAQVARAMVWAASFHMGAVQGYSNKEIRTAAAQLGSGARLFHHVS